MNWKIASSLSQGWLDSNQTLLKSNAPSRGPLTDVAFTNSYANQRLFESSGLLTNCSLKVSGSNAYSLSPSISNHGPKVVFRRSLPACVACKQLHRNATTPQAQRIHQRFAASARVAQSSRVHHTTTPSATINHHQ